MERGAEVAEAERGRESEKFNAYRQNSRSRSAHMLWPVCKREPSVYRLKVLTTIFMFIGVIGCYTFAVFFVL